MELTLTFSGQVLPSYPSVILFVVPLFVGSGDIRASYLQQILNGDATASTAVSLESIFTTGMTSFGYKTCLDLAPEEQGQGSAAASINLYVLYFPEGISFSQQEIVSLSTLVSPKGGNPPPYSLPPPLLNGLSTVSSYTVESDGTMVPTALSAQGIVGTQQLTSSTDEFINLFQYFNKPPTVGTTPNTSCPAYTTSQYKCMPFNKLRDLSGNLADPNNPYVTLQDRIAGGSAMQDSVPWDYSSVGPILLDIAFAAFAIVAVSFFIYYVFFNASSRTKMIVVATVGTPATLGTTA